MGKNNGNESVKTRIIRATGELLQEKDIDSITGRDIAQRANVGLGNINYHFKSKDNLLVEVVLQSFQGNVIKSGSNPSEGNNPREELEQVIYELFEFMLTHKTIGRYVAKHKLTSKTFNSERILLQYISKYYRDTEICQLNLRMKAVQINASLLVSLVNREEFYKYTDIDPYNKADLKKMIKVLVQNVLHG